METMRKRPSQFRRGDVLGGRVIAGTMAVRGGWSVTFQDDAEPKRSRYNGRCKYEVESDHAPRPRPEQTPYQRVRSLVRSAKIHMGKADAIRQYERLYDGTNVAAFAEADVHEQKAVDAVKEAIRLNDEHGLGYPVPPSALRWANR